MAAAPKRTRAPKRPQIMETNMRLRMTKDRDFTPPDERRVTVAYTAEGEYTVKRAWGEAMVESGDAVEIDPPAASDDA